MEIGRKKYTLWLVWVVLLLISSLPNILWQEIGKQSAEWMIYVKCGLLLALFSLSFIIKQVKFIRRFSMIAFGVLLLEYLSYRISLLSFWTKMSNGIVNITVSGLIGVQLRRVVIAIFVIGFLFLLGYKRKDFFFVKGDSAAGADEVKVFGIDQGTPWKKLGGWLAFFISIGTLVFLLLAGQPTFSALVDAFPLFPIVLLLSAANAFSEEMIYRAAWLAPLEPLVGKKHSIWMMAVLFGLAHYYGVPYGIIGVLMSGALGWFLTKSMIETKGFFWPWFIHFCQDILIFSFIIIGSVTPGG